VQNIYKNAKSSVQINGYRSSPVQTKSSIRRGFPLSMIIHAMCLNSLLCTLNDALQGLRIGRQHTKIIVVTYADDVTIFITSPFDIPKLQEAIQCYEAASGAKVNIHKSRAVALGAWDRSLEILNIPYQDTATILGMKVKSTIKESAHASWTKTVTTIRVQAQESYHRLPSLDKRIQFVHEHLVLRAWYVSQICPHLKKAPVN
jgi:hypothetical protein